MSDICRIHSTQPATFVCSQCGANGCLGCENIVAGKKVCSTCVAAIQNKIRNEMNAGAGQTVNPPSFTPSPLIGASGNILLGTVAGLIVGIAGAFIWDKIVLITHFQIGIVASLLGYAVGYAVVMAGKGHGTLPAIVSSVIALLSMLLGRVLLTHDLLMEDHIDNIGLSVIIQHLFDVLRPFDYVFIAIGVWGAWSTGSRGIQRR